MTKALEHKAVRLTSKRLSADANGRYPEMLEIARVGEWHTPWHGDFILTIEDFDEAIQQFNSGFYRVEGTEPLAAGLDHDPMGGPATFRMNRLFREGDSLMTSVSWTELGKEKIDRDEYRYVSFEYYPRSMPFENPEVAGDMRVNVLTGATLTNDPLFKKLKPVMASARGGGDNHNIGDDMNLEQIRVKDLKDLTTEERAFLIEQQSKLTEAERAKFEITVAETPEEKAKREADEKAAADKEAADKKAAEEAEAKRVADEAEEQRKLEASTKGMNAEQKKLFASMRADITKLEAQAQAGADAANELLRTRLTASVTSHVDRGAIKSDELTNTIDMLMASTADAREAQLGFMSKLPDNKMLAKTQGTGLDASADSVTVTDEEVAVAASFGNTREQLIEYKKSLIN